MSVLRTLHRRLTSGRQRSHQQLPCLWISMGIWLLRLRRTCRVRAQNSRPVWTFLGRVLTLQTSLRVQPNPRPPASLSITAQSVLSYVHDAHWKPFQGPCSEQLHSGDAWPAPVFFYLPAVLVLYPAWSPAVPVVSALQAERAPVMWVKKD